MSARHVMDTELAEMQERAYRVRDNERASGSARALARDLIRLTTLLQSARRGRTAGRRRSEQLADLELLWDLPTAE